MVPGQRQGCGTNHYRENRCGVLSNCEKTHLANTFDRSEHRPTAEPDPNQDFGSAGRSILFDPFDVSGGDRCRKINNFISHTHTLVNPTRGHVRYAKSCMFLWGTG